MRLNLTPGAYALGVDRLAHLFATCGADRPLCLMEIEARVFKGQI